MTLKPLTYFLLLGSVALSFSSIAKENIPVVTDEAELRNITDTYRGNPEREKDFIPQGDGTVIDRRTGLQWMRCSLGQKWSGETCEGKSAEYNWEQANKVSSDFAGYDDWRLPTIWELETLVYCSSGEFEPRGEKYKQLRGCIASYQSPALVGLAFPNVTPKDNIWYWSSSLSADYDEVAWGVYFSRGFTNFHYKYFNDPVLLVRSGK